MQVPAGDTHPPEPAHQELLPVGYVRIERRRLASINRPSTGSHNGDSGPPPPLLPVFAGGAVGGGVLVSPPELANGPQAQAYFQRALSLMQAALAQQNPALQPLDWAITQQNLCLARHEWGARQGVPGVALVRQAAEDCGAALHWLSRAQSPFDWAMAQNNLAISQAVLAQLQDDTASMHAAIGSFEQAQTVYTRDAVPVQWAMVEVNLGKLYCRVARGNHGGFDLSAQHTSQALAVFIGKKMRRYQAYAQSQLDGVKACAARSAHCTCSGS